MIDDKGGNVKEAGPSIAVSVLGFSEVPSAGDLVFAMENEKLAKRVADERLAKIKTEMTKTSGMVTLDDVFEKIAEGQIKGLNIVLKADLQGSVEAVGQALEKLSTAEVKVNIIHSGVGAINESDIRLAQTAAAIIIGFSVRPELKAKQLAERENVDIRLYRIIYDVTDDVEKALKGMLEPKYKETQLGQAEVRNVFKISGAGTVAGCYVINGKILRNAKVRLIRDGIVIAESTIASLKRFKDDAKEVAQGFECGIAIENYNDIKESDIIECFAMEEITE
jgi:translation initiation factor IF-2